MQLMKRFYCTVDSILNFCNILHKKKLEVFTMFLEKFKSAMFVLAAL